MKTSKNVQGSVNNMLEANRHDHKLQLQRGWNEMQRKSMSIKNYTLKIKSLCSPFSSIKVTVDEVDMVQIFLNDLLHQIGSLRAIIITMMSLVILWHSIDALFTNKTMIGLWILGWKAKYWTFTQTVVVIKEEEEVQPMIEFCRVCQRVEDHVMWRHQRTFEPQWKT